MEPLEPLQSTADRMYEADQHLDRLGTILRSLRAPSDRVPLTAATTVVQKPARRQDSSYCESPPTPSTFHHHSPVPLRQQHVQKQQSSAPPQRGTSIIDASRRPGTPYQQRVGKVVAGGLSSTVGRRGYATAQQATGSPQNNTTGVVGAMVDRRSSPPKQARLDSAIPAVHPPLHCISSGSSSTLPPPTVLGGAVPIVPCRKTSRNSSGAAPINSKPFGQRVIRTWWRGLSCGVCFAAGAWARDGHGVLGVALALAAVCGELMLNERVAAAVMPLDC